MANANNYDKGAIFQERFKELVGKSTQEEVAKKVNTSRQNVGNWLNGKSRPDIYALAEISKGYNVSTDYLLGLTDIKSTDTTIQGVCEYTGLAEQAVKTILAIKELEKYTKNLNVKCKYTLVDSLNFIVEELGNDIELLYDFNNTLNYDNKEFINIDDFGSDDIRDIFYEKFPEANKWIFDICVKRLRTVFLCLLTIFYSFIILTAFKNNCRKFR